MKAAKTFALTVALVLLAYGAIGFYFLPTASFYGEMTRMGLLPESMFGWKKAQPALDPSLFQPASWQDADVLVIGDSFSEPRIWQTILVQHGLKVRTLHWSNVRGICEDFPSWLRAQGFKGKWVIFQIIERNITDLPRNTNCKKLEFHPSFIADMPYPPPISNVPDTNLAGKFSIGIATAWHAREYERLADQPGFQSTLLPNGIRAARVENGCQLFSHARCNEALFLGVDSPSDVDSNVLDSAAIIDKRLSDFKTMWVFVPNKSTSYLYPDKKFWKLAQSRLNAPDILEIFQQSLRKGIVDLYPGSNTHLSTDGYLIMGEAIYRNMTQR